MSLFMVKSHRRIVKRLFTRFGVTLLCMSVHTTIYPSNSLLFSLLLLSVCKSVFLPVFMSVSLSLSLYLYTSISPDDDNSALRLASLFIRLRTYMLSLYYLIYLPSIQHSIIRPICPSFHQYVYLYVHLLALLSISLPSASICWYNNLNV